MIKQLTKCWRFIVLVAAPLSLAPIIVFYQDDVSNCAFCVLLMAIYWTTEALPLAVTALLPIILFPLFGLRSTNEVCMVYLKETNMLFLGGLIVAVAVEYCNLHKRIALKVLLFVGTTPRWIMLGFMLTTMFLSMWINNTAATAMMVPIIEAVIEQLQKGLEINTESTSNDVSVETNKPIAQGLSRENLHSSQSVLVVNGKQSQSEFEMAYLPSSEGEDSSSATEQPAQQNINRLKIGLFLATAYACNLGGTGSLNGTAPNLVLKGQLEQLFGPDTGLNFATWMMFNVPTMCICIVAAWIWLQFLYVRPICRRNADNKEREKNIRQLIQQKYRDLGPITFHEIEVMILFVLLVSLWMLRDPKFINGWQVWFPKKKIGDSTSVMLIVILLFALPAKLDNWKTGGLQQRALNWKTVHEKLPWNVILLIGGGFAMADASKVSGLSKWVGTHLIILKSLPTQAIVFVIAIITAMLTEVASNTATATIFLPVLADMSKSLAIHPLYTMLPATVACSYAFMLPIATPPNAIVFTSAGMKTLDMMVPGILMNFLCVGIVTFMINTLGVYMFDLHNFPAWANATNFTISS